MENKPKSCGSYGVRHIIFIMRNQKQRFYILLRAVKIISKERSESILIRAFSFPEKRKLYITVMHCLFVCLFVCYKQHLGLSTDYFWSKTRVPDSFYRLTFDCPDVSYILTRIRAISGFTGDVT